MKKAVLTLYCVLGVVSITLGSIYVLSPTFMPYHAMAISREWGDLTSAEQVLFSALLDVAGAGWIALGVAIICLTLVPVRRGEAWARYLVPSLAFIFYIPTLMATLSVLHATAASPPWWGNLIALTAALTAFLMDRPFSSNRQAGVT